MKKNDLKKLRILKATPKMLTMAASDTLKKRKSGGYRCYWSSEVYEYGLYMRCQILQGILKVAFFLPEHLRSGGNLPVYELFISRAAGQFITYDCMRNKWLTAKVDMLPWPNYVFNSKKKWINPQGYASIKQYLGVEHGGFTGILDYQLSVRAEELKQKHKRETTPWDLDLAQTPELPKDWKQWCNKVGIPQNYIFYEYSRKGAEKGYCTYCEKDVAIKHPRHNKTGRCLVCRHKIVFKSIGKAGTVLTDRAYMYLIQRCEDGFMIREFQGCRKYPKGEFLTPECSHWEIRRSIYDKTGVPLRAYAWGDYKHSEERWVKTGICTLSWWGNHAGKIYGKTLPDLSKKELKYTGLIERIYDGTKLDPEKYLTVLQEVPQLEQISKAKLSCLVDDCISSYYSFSKWLFAPEESSLTKMLGVNTSTLKRLRENHGGTKFLEWIAYEKSTGKGIPDHVISWLCAENITVNSLSFISNKMSILQIYNYIRRQMSEGGMKSKEVLTTWSDYLAMARSLDMDVSDEIIFRVRKLRQRHDELVSRCESKDISILAGEILKKFPFLNKICQSLKKYEYADENYTVLAPNRIDEIIWEGRNLSHCAGKSDRYWERIARREAYVLFLRKTNALDNPHYTLEVEPDGTIRQKRTRFNRQEEDIKDATSFLKKWQKVVTKRLNTEDYELAQKSRVLRNQEFAQLKKEQVIIPTGELGGNLLVDVLLADLMENTQVAPVQELSKAA